MHERSILLPTLKEGFIASVLLVLLALFVLWWGTVSVGYVAGDTLEVSVYEGEAASAFLNSVDAETREALLKEMNKGE